MRGKWVCLAYRELIGSLYESWKIGIERVYSEWLKVKDEKRFWRKKSDEKRNRPAFWERL